MEIFSGTDVNISATLIVLNNDDSDFERRLKKKNTTPSLCASSRFIRGCSKTHDTWYLPCSIKTLDGMQHDLLRAARHHVGFWFGFWGLLTVRHIHAGWWYRRWFSLLYIHRGPWPSNNLQRWLTPIYLNQEGRGTIYTK